VEVLTLEILLPVADMPVNGVLVVILGFLIGGISGLFGVGGGFMLTPFLNVFLGIPYNIAVGSSLGQMIFTSFSGVAKHLILKNVDIRLAGLFIAGSVPGIFLGVNTIGSFSSEKVYVILGREYCQMDLFMSAIYLCFLLFMGAYMLKESLQSVGEECEAGSPLIARFRGITLKPLMGFISTGWDKLSVWPVAGIGFIVGFLSGLLGIGGGFLLLPALLYVVGVSTRFAVGTSLMQTFAISVFGASSHFFSGNVDPILVLLLLAGSLAGAQAGAAMTARINCASIRKYFGVIVLIAAVMVASKFF
jgi:hypothetical protein